MIKKILGKISKVIISGLVFSSCMLANVGAVPHVIFGTWQTGDKTQELVISAIKSGIRHIDTAQSYGNECMVGAAVRKCIQEGIIKRKDIEVTTKIKPEEVMKRCNSPAKYTYDAVSELIDESLTRLGLGYIDTVLIHEEDPINGFEIWKGLAEYKAKHPDKIRKIGLSNYMFNWLCEQTVRIAKPNVVQNPFFPSSNKYFNNSNVYYNWANHNDIEFEGYKPIGHGLLMNNFFIKELAKKYNVSPATICLQYSLLSGVSPVFSSTNSKHILQNMQELDKLNFSSKATEMDILNECLLYEMVETIIFSGQTMN